MLTEVLRTEHLTIGYRKRTVARALSLSLQAGEFVCLLGPNGAGKSTLMRTLAGLQAALSGEVWLVGESVGRLSARELALRLSVVLTERIDVGMLTGYGLVALGRHPHTDWTGQLSKEDERVIKRAVAAVGAGELAARPISELSDGERQKLMIARALAQEPLVMLLDEPTAYLDLPRRVEIILLLRELAHDSGRAVIVSTHDLDLALRNADKVWLLDNAGTMHVGAPEDLILNGAFEQAFSSTGVLFDMQTGAFVADIESDRSIAVTGDGIRAVWTRRALERAGYSIASDSHMNIQVNLSDWVLDRGATSQAFSSLHDLIIALHPLE